MKIAAYYRGNPSRTNERVAAVAKALGASPELRDHPVPCDLAIQAGFQMTAAMRDAMDRQTPILILENPVWHYGDKSSVYSIGYNGLAGLSSVPSCKHLDARPRPELLPWRDVGAGQITVFGQVENDKALRGLDIYGWVDNILKVLPEAHFREHPVMLRRDNRQESFEECLRKTSLAVTYSSTVGAEAVIAGISTIAQHPGSLARPMASQTLSEAPRQPNRDNWIHALSYRQWSTTEQLDTEWLLGGYDEAKVMAENGRYDNMSNGRAQ